MLKTEPLFAALLDASPEHAHLESPVLASRARALGTALGKAQIGIMARIGSPLVSTALGACRDAGCLPIAFSPAGSLTEHTQAFRLPLAPGALVCTGRGALGADIVSLQSANAIVVLGSNPDGFEHVLTLAKDTMLPIGILTDEAPASIHERVRARSARLTPLLLISNDPAILVREISAELRRRGLALKNPR